MLRIALSLLLCALSAPVLAPGAQAADLVAGVTPLAMHSTGPAPACPTAAEANGSLAAAAGRGAAAPQAAFWGSYEAASTFTLSVATTIAVCDPEMASVGRAPGPITGSAVNPPTGDSVGFGLRMLGAPISEPAAAASVGDRFVLPAVGARATVDLVVRTASGAGSVRLGPFASAPVAVRVGGTGQAPVAVAELSDGSTAQAPVVAPRAVSPRLRATIRKNRLKLRLTGVPGALLVAAKTASPGDVRVAGYDPNGVVEVANTKGIASGVVSDMGADRFLEALDLRPSRTPYVLVGILDADRRIYTALTCRLRWSGRTLKRVRCRPTTAAERAHPLPEDGTLPDAVRGFGAGVSPPGRAATGLASSARRATRSAAPSLLPVSTTVVTRLRGRAIIEFDDEDHPFVGDLNGDGRPDFGIDPTGAKPKVALSLPTGGWSRVPLLTDVTTQPTVVPDFTGDGTDDISVPFESRIIGGSRLWATALPKAIDLRAKRAFTAGDATMRGFGGRTIRADLFPLPDTSGDGRPELGVHPYDEAGYAVFASESVPFGRTSQLPVVRTVSFADELAAFRRLTGLEEEESETFREQLNVLVARRGGALLWNRTAKYVLKDTETQASSTISLRPISPGAPWAPSAQPSLSLTGMAEVDDYDPATGESLVTTNLDACDLRTYTCTARVLRVGREGQVTATATFRAAGALAVKAAFADDGADPDDRRDVLISGVPGSNLTEDDTSLSGGSIAHWSSSTPAADIATLPLLATGGSPLLLAGPLEHWTAPDGTRRHAGYVQSGSDKSLTQTLVLLDALG